MNVKNRGFASMDAERQRAIASKGGKMAHDKGTAHRWTAETAKAAAARSKEVRQRKKALETPQAEV